MPTGKKITDPSIPQTGSGLSDFAGLLTLGVNSQNQSVRIPLGDILHRTIVRAGVIYRIDTEHPLTSGYYTLTTAIQTIAADVNVSADERSGMVLIFYDGTVFRIYQFEKKYDNSGGVEPSVKFLNTDNWKELDLYAKADKADVYTKEEVDEMNDGMEENIVALMEKKADKTGLHHSLGSGTSDGLAGTDVVDAEYTLRCTGDKMSNLGTGAATIETVKGNTLVWNQLIQDSGTPSGGNGLTVTYSNCVFTVSGLSTSSSYFGLWGLYTNPIVNNKYLLMIEPITWEVVGGYFFIALRCNTSIQVDNDNLVSIGIANSSHNTIRIYHDNNVSVNVSFKLNVFDLTTMFGAEHEPSADNFKLSYPLSHYPFNRGKLISNLASGIKTIGFNAYNPSTGRVVVIKGHQYQITGTYTAISYSDGTTITPDSNGLFTPILNDELNVTGGNSTDTCVHLAWSGYRNGEYEPYQENTVYFDSDLGASGSLATIKGRKLNAQGEIDDPTAPSAAVFLDGMNSVGTAYDEAKGQYATKTLKFVKASNLSWGGPYTSDTVSYFRCNVSDAKSISAWNDTNRLNILISSVYTIPSTLKNSISSYLASDLTFGKGASGQLFILRDDSVATPAALVQKLNNNDVYICYELDTQEQYLLDNPLPSCYAENKLGTEERLPKDTASAVNAPLKYTVKYPMNIAKNYVSADSISNLLTELATKFGAAMSKTITITPTFNENTQEFDYSINIT